MLKLYCHCGIWILKLSGFINVSPSLKGLTVLTDIVTHLLRTRNGKIHELEHLFQNYCFLKYYRRIYK